MSSKFYNVYGTAGRYDKNYHVLAESQSKARQRVQAEDPELRIRSITLETRKLFVELGEPAGAHQQAYTETEQAGGLYLYDEGT